MKLRTSPALRVASSGPAGVRFEDVAGGGEYDVDTVVATLLRELREPEERERLVGDLAIPAPVLDELVEHRLLVDALDPLAILAGVITAVSPTFAVAPFGAVPAHVAFIGVPYDAMSVTGGGAAGGPAAIRLTSGFPAYTVDPESGEPAGWYDASTSRQVLRGVRLTDLGDVYIGSGDSSSQVGSRIRAAVHVCRSLEIMPVLLGGDHSLTWWALQGLDRDRLSVLHLDAHTDLAPPPPRGFPSNASVVGAIAQLPNIETLVTAGTRSFLPVAQPQLWPGHHVVSMRETRCLGVTGLVDLLPPDLPCYVTLDVDALDPSVMPATNVPVHGGFTFEEMAEILDAVASRRRIAGIDVVEINPSRDPHLVATRVAGLLLRTLLAAAFAQRQVTA